MSLTATLVGCVDDSGGAETGTPTDTSTGTATDATTETGTPEDETTAEEETEAEPAADRPANFRWDMNPGQNDDLRDELGQYISGGIGGLVEDHPAFDYSTDSERDDHTVDFEALKLYRDSNFDIMAAEPDSGPLEDLVEAFVDDSMYQNSKNNLFKSHPDSPSQFTLEAWQSAETVEESLDLGHNLLVTIGYGPEQISNEETGVAIREAYKRHHDFDVLAWGVPMQNGSLTQGMMYSPDDDKVRAFAGLGDWNGDGEAQFHTEIQDWRVINNPENAGNNPDDLQHPALFHTDEWDRQGVGFEDAKDDAVDMIFSIATDDYNSYNVDALSANDAPIDNITMTTGAAEQLSRTLLDYNKSGVDADFEDIWNLANFAVGKYLDNTELNGVIDTVEPGEDYDEYFGGGFAFYEVEDEEIVDEVRNDQAGEYDNFGQVYDELEAV